MYLGGHAALEKPELHRIACIAKNTQHHNLHKALIKMARCNRKDIDSLATTISNASH